MGPSSLLGSGSLSSSLPPSLSSLYGPGVGPRRRSLGGAAPATAVLALGARSGVTSAAGAAVGDLSVHREQGAGEPKPQQQPPQQQGGWGKLSAVPEHANSQGHDAASGLGTGSMASGGSHGGRSGGRGGSRRGAAKVTTLVDREPVLAGPSCRCACIHGPVGVHALQVRTHSE